MSATPSSSHTHFFLFDQQKIIQFEHAIAWNLLSRDSSISHDELDSTGFYLDPLTMSLVDFTQWSQTHEGQTTLHHTPYIWLNFAKFVDGRSYSIAQLLRHRYEYKGQLLAYGSWSVEQIPLLKNLSFDGFQVHEHDQASDWGVRVDALLSLEPKHYQPTL